MRDSGIGAGLREVLAQDFDPDMPLGGRRAEALFDRPPPAAPSPPPMGLVVEPPPWSPQSDEYEEWLFRPPPPQLPQPEAPFRPPRADWAAEQREREQHERAKQEAEWLARADAEKESRPAKKKRRLLG